MKPLTIWLTGLPCSGKTTIAKGMVYTLRVAGEHVLYLDGDEVRKTLCSDLGFSEDDRFENIRRIAEISRILNNSRISVIASFVSPTNKIRSMAGDIIGDKFRLVWVKCSPEECEKRDVKGMWKKARAGKIKNFTGLDGVFEEPDGYQMVVDTEKDSIEDCVLKIIKELKLVQ